MYTDRPEGCVRNFAVERHRHAHERAGSGTGAGALAARGRPCRNLWQPLGVVLVGVALLAGCSSTVTGSAQPDAAAVHAGASGTESPSAARPPSPSTTSTRSAPSATPTTGGGTREPSPGASDAPAPSGSLTRLLPEASAFPAGFADSAAVLPHRDAVAASEDLAGLHRGARTEPVRCEPGSQPPGPGDLAMRSSTNGRSRSTVAVQLERVRGSLDDYRDTISACTDVTSNRFGAQSTITRTMVDDPALDGGGNAVAFRQSVRSGSDELVLDQRSTTLAAQVGDVRILVVGMAQNGEAPGADELAGLLQVAVDRVQAG